VKNVRKSNAMRKSAKAKKRGALRVGNDNVSAPARASSARATSAALASLQRAANAASSPPFPPPPPRVERFFRHDARVDVGVPDLDRHQKP